MPAGPVQPAVLGRAAQPSDFMHVSTWQRWLYLAFFIDVFARLPASQPSLRQHSDSAGVAEEDKTAGKRPRSSIAVEFSVYLSCASHLHRGIRKPVVAQILRSLATLRAVARSPLSRTPACCSRRKSDWVCIVPRA